MAIQDTIFRNEIIRQVESGKTKLIGRPATDPTFLEEANYFLQHGMTRAQAAEAASLHLRHEFEGAAVADLEGEPPESICNVKGLGPRRALYARYFAWRQRLAVELSELATKKSRFEEMIAAPDATGGAIRKAVRRDADRLMGRASDSSDDAGRKNLDDRLASERHCAEAAREAMPELDAKIDRAQLRLAKLNERETEFLHPAIVEVADSIGLGALYLKKINEVREVAALMFGLAQTVGGYGSGFGAVESIKFPRAGLPSIAHAESDRYAISAVGRTDAWSGLAQSLLLDPWHDASKFVALPK